MGGQPSFSGPLYQQVHAHLLGRITSGEWRSGAPIPGEADLSRELGVSVGTVRKALDQLARDRIVVRERGRGTFVKDAAERWPGTPQGFRLCDAEGRSLSPDVRTVSTVSGRPTAAEATTLRIMRHASMIASVLRIRREWRAANRLICLETVVVDEARFPGLAEVAASAAESLFAIYTDHFRTTVGRTVWSFKPVAASEAHAGLADQDGATLLHCRRVAYDQKDLPIEISDQVLGFASEAYQLVQ
ncbi:MAG: GntR family transcriptional regulator [Hyphomicrobiaceae bacterium]